jgi:glycosyltransferase involved in cell wall biosynthesis
MPESDKLPLSVVIIARNEELRLRDCLRSVAALTDEVVVVVDACSTDGTAEVARAAGARVLVRAWTGFSDQKNFGQEAARHDWILSLDADERVTPALAASIRSAWAAGPACDAYAIRFHSHFAGVRVCFGAWNPEYHVRLFDRRKFQWSCAEVHEGLEGVAGARVGRLDGAILHFTVDSGAQLAAKTDRYSALFAEKLRRQGRRPGWEKVWLNPPWRFVRDYLLRGGLLDGRIGFVIAWESARYTHLKYRLALPAGGGVRVPWAIPVAAAAVALAFVLAGGTDRTADPLHGDLLAAAEHADDGFDNRATLILRRLTIDEDVVL